MNTQPPIPSPLNEILERIVNSTDLGDAHHLGMMALELLDTPATTGPGIDNPDVKAALLQAMDENRLFANEPAHVRVLAAEILANAVCKAQPDTDSPLKPEGERTKYEELEACYAMLFRQLNQMGEIIKARSDTVVMQDQFRDVTKMVAAVQPCYSMLIERLERLRAGCLSSRGQERDELLDEVIAIVREYFSVRAASKNEAKNTFANGESVGCQESERATATPDDTVPDMVRETALGVILNYRDVIPVHIIKWAESKVNLPSMGAFLSIADDKKDLQRGEISVVDKKSLRERILSDPDIDIDTCNPRLALYMKCPDPVLQEELLRLYFLNAPKPVSLNDVYHNERLVYLVLNHDNTYASLKEIAQTVLDATGVRYTD